VKQSRFFDTLAAVAGVRPAGASAPQRQSLIGRAAVDERLAAARVLLAEDNPTNQMVIVGILKKGGVRVDVAANGFEAIEALRNVPYDLVLMDVQMPDMDGLEATRRIRDPGSRVLDPSIPIIAMTAHAMVGDRETCIEAGMDDYVTKPVRPLDLFETIGRWYPREEKKMSEESGHEPARTAVARAAAGPDFDPAWLRSRLGDDEETISLILETFLEDAVTEIDAIERALRDDDAEGVRRHGHKLKGAAGEVGAVQFSATAKEIEAAGDAKDLANLESLLSRLSECFARCKTEIRRTFGGGKATAR